MFFSLLCKKKIHIQNVNENLQSQYEKELNRINYRVLILAILFFVYFITSSVRDSILPEDLLIRNTQIQILILYSLNFFLLKTAVILN